MLAIDYRGFGKSTAGLPSESTAYEDAHAAWQWLAEKYPERPRYIFGHSLGGPIAINLATEVNGLSEHAARFNVGSNAASAIKHSSRARFDGPLKQLPAAAVAKLVRPAAGADDWQSF